MVLWCSFVCGRAPTAFFTLAFPVIKKLLAEVQYKKTHAEVRIYIIHMSL